MKTVDKLVIISVFILFIISAFVVLCGCTSFDPKNDKNVSYTFESVSYQSPNSAPTSNITGMKQNIKVPFKL